MSYRPENDPELSALISKVQKLAASLDEVTRNRGVPGVAWVAANITAANREVEWKCRDIMRSTL